MGMPTALGDIGIETTKENFDLLYREMCKSNFVSDEVLFEYNFNNLFQNKYDS